MTSIIPLAHREQLLRQVLTDSERALALAQTSYRVGQGDLRAVQQQQLNVQAARLTCCARGASNWPSG